MPLTGKTAVITGSTRGLGRQIAESFAAAGCKVVLNGFAEPEEIREIELHLGSQYSVETLYHGADLTKPAETDQMMAAALARFGSVEILVNNAGMQHVAPIESFPMDKWDMLISLNLSAAFHTTRAVLDGMRRKKWGRIVNIASAHGLVASPYKSAYVAAKHGLIGFTKVTALETARDGITCNALCPGYIHTSIVEGQIEEQARAAGLPRERVIEEIILARHPTREFVTTHQVAEFVLFLCSDGGASVTGAAIPIDGGWTAH